MKKPSFHAIIPRMTFDPPSAFLSVGPNVIRGLLFRRRESLGRVIKAVRGDTSWCLQLANHVHGARAVRGDAKLQSFICSGFLLVL